MDKFDSVKNDCYMQKAYLYKLTLKRYETSKHRSQDKGLLPKLVQEMLICIKDVRENIPEYTRNFTTMVDIRNETLEKLEKELVKELIIIQNSQ